MTRRQLSGHEGIQQTKKKAPRRRPSAKMHGGTLSQAAADKFARGLAGEEAPKEGPKEEEKGLFGPESERSFLDIINPFEKTDPEAVKLALERSEKRGNFPSEELPGAIFDAALLGGGGEILGKAAGLGIKSLRGAGAGVKGTSEFAKLGAKRQDVIQSLIKGNTRKGLSTADAAISREIAGAKLSRLLSRPGVKISQDAGVRAINSYNAWGKSKVMKFLTKKPVKKTLQVGGAFLGADILTTWYALDNVMDGLRFMVPDIVEGVNNGTMSRDEAVSAFAEADATMNMAYYKVRVSAIINPLLWPAAKLLLNSSDIKRDSYNLKKENAFTNLGL